MYSRDTGRGNSREGGGGSRALAPCSTPRNERVVCTLKRAAPERAATGLPVRWTKRVQLVRGREEACPVSTGNGREGGGGLPMHGPA